MIEYILANEGDIAAVIAEPMRWTTVVPPTAEYWRKVRASCDQHGTLLVIDEIPACLGRTGKMFCFENFEIDPDILVIGKGLGGGVFPLAAVIARGDLNIAVEQSLGHFTHEKSPVGAAAALATLDVINQEHLVERSRALGAKTAQRLKSFAETIPLVHEVRGLGLQIAVELRRDGQSAIEESERILYECLARGLSFKISGGNVLTLSPPLTISDAEMDQAISILETSIATQT
jgi:4-aminobutyrate aminotransferase